MNASFMASGRARRSSSARPGASWTTCAAARCGSTRSDGDPRRSGCDVQHGFPRRHRTDSQAVPKERQTVFFSATMPRPIQDLIQATPAIRRLSASNKETMTVPTVEQDYYEVDRRFKVELLTRLIDIHDFQLGIIFCNTKRMVDELVDHLEAQGYSADRLHGDMTQAMRDRVMNKFRKSGLEFLVATDVAARGIDVDDVQVVFNYDLPYECRTTSIASAAPAGLAAADGPSPLSRAASSFKSSISSASPGRRFTAPRFPPRLKSKKRARASFLERLRVTLKSGEYLKQDHLVERLLEEGFSSTDIASALIHHLQNPDGAPEARPEKREAPYAREDDRRRDPPRNFEQARPAPARAVRADRPPAVNTTKPVAPRPAAPPARPPATVQQKAIPPAPVAAAVTPAVPLPTVEPPSPPPPPPPVAEPAIVLPPAKPKVRVGPPLAKGGVVPAAAPKHIPPPKQDQVRLHVNVGAEVGVTATDLSQAIAGATGLPASVVGPFDVRDRYSFVDVAAEHAKAIIAKLNRTQVRGRKLKVKVA